MRLDTSLSQSIVLVITLALCVVPPLAAGQSTSETTSAASLVDIRFSFKLDPRLAGPTYGGEQWVSPATFLGATAQDFVEVQAAGVDAGGRPITITPEWIAADPEMVKVSPTEGNRVTITVERAGESTIEVAAQGVSEELSIKAQMTPFPRLEIRQRPALGSATHAATAPQGLEAPDAWPLASQTERLSYALGMSLGNAARRQSITIDAALLAQGLEDALSGGETVLTERQAQAVLLMLRNDFRTRRPAAGAEQQRELATRDDAPAN